MWIHRVLTLLEEPLVLFTNMLNQEHRVRVYTTQVYTVDTFVGIAQLQKEFNACSLEADQVGLANVFALSL